MTGLGTQVSQQCFWTAGGPTTLLDWDWATKKFGNKVIQRNVDYLIKKWLTKSYKYVI